MCVLQILVKSNRKHVKLSDSDTMQWWLYLSEL